VPVRPYRSRIAVGAVAGLLIAVLAVVGAPPAGAQTCGSGASRGGGGGLDASAWCFDASPERPASASSGWNTYCAGEYGAYVPGRTSISVVNQVDQTPTYEIIVNVYGYDPTAEYDWFSIFCNDATIGLNDLVTVAFLRTTDPVPPTVLRDRALASIVAPAPVPQSNPPLESAIHVTRKPTYLYLPADDWAEIGPAEECAGFVCVQVMAEPRVATWDMGDGGAATVCDGPGVPWSPGASDDCTHTFVHSSGTRADGVFHGQVSVTWDYYWWVNGTLQGGGAWLSEDLATPFDVTVGEILAVNDGGY
jgi:hypothetical protein